MGRRKHIFHIKQDNFSGTGKKKRDVNSQDFIHWIRNSEEELASGKEDVKDYTK